LVVCWLLVDCVLDVSGVSVVGLLFIVQFCCYHDIMTIVRYFGVNMDFFLYNALVMVVVLIDQQRMYWFMLNINGM
jgi:hypothetical protein